MDKSIARIDDTVVAININQTYRQGISVGDLYDCTRGIWRLSRTRAGGAQYAFAVYQSEIKEVYEVERWLPAGSTKYQRRQFTPSQLMDRYEFVGNVARDEIRD